MLHHCKVPCNECPFTKNSLPGYLGEYTVHELHGIIMSEVLFPCHMTHDFDMDAEVDSLHSQAGTKEHPLCAGALLYMKKAAKIPKNPEHNEIVKKFNNSEHLNNILSVREFFEHHNKS